MHVLKVSLQKNLYRARFLALNHTIFVKIITHVLLRYTTAPKQRKH